MNIKRVGIEIKILFFTFIKSRDVGGKSSDVGDAVCTDLMI